MLNMYESNVGAKHSRHQKVYASLPTLLPIGPSMYAENVHDSLTWCEPTLTPRRGADAGFRL